ncbi:MAG: PD40 domain-containing protein [Armatimonadetes bacterium]|nr:PD40 domain-containing protein [Armatimonadota bacterium]
MSAAQSQPELDALKRFIQAWAESKRTGQVAQGADVNGDGLLDFRDAVVAINRVLARGGTTERISVSSAGVQANGDCDFPSLSPDGRYVVFHSYASSLVPGDTNGLCDVFVRDRSSGVTERISVASDGREANGASFVWRPSVSADGRYVVFVSDADNLVPRDYNGQLFSDAFLHDRAARQTVLVDVATNGEQGEYDADHTCISADGRYVAFESPSGNLVPDDTNWCWDVFIRNLVTGQTARVSVSTTGTQGNDTSESPYISADGRYVAFESFASNLVPNDHNRSCDIFVHDCATGVTERVSVPSGGGEANDSSFAPSISADGRYVAFESRASNLVPNDTNDRSDIFVYDRHTGLIKRVSVSSTGEQANNGSTDAHISADGRYVVFVSYASNLVPGDTNHLSDVFVHDMATGETVRVSVSSSGEQANGDSYHPFISADGRFIVFACAASNLVPGDTNDAVDIFIHDRWPWLGR